MSFLGISEHIHKTLSQSASLKRMIGDKIQPIVTKREVDFPFVVYKRDSIAIEYDKSGKATVTTTVDVYVLAETYTESVEIAEEVIKSLNRVYADYDKFSVIGASLTSANEDYVSQTYVQQLTFNFLIQ